MAGAILAIAGLALAAPAAHYATQGRWSVEALWLWLLSGLYFASGVLYVKFRVLSAHARDERVRRWCAAYHSFLLASLAALTATGSLNLFALIAFAPVLARAFWHLVRPSGRLNLKRIGWLEVAYSVLFVLFAAASFQ
ncbi:MAG: hypothetical protein AAB225_15675 [Acidobacteriota bacterium]